MKADFSKTNIAIVISSFNQKINNKLLESTYSQLLSSGVNKKNIKQVWVPGAFELPLAAAKLAEKILEVLHLPQDQKDAIGLSARRRVKEKFSLNDMLKKTLTVYEDLLSTKKNFSN